jgi:hypothetical protein
MPKSFKLIFEYVRGLDLHKEIDYDKIKELFFNCAKEAGISLNPNNSEHKFNWMHESKLNTRGAFYFENVDHLRS